MILMTISLIFLLVFHMNIVCWYFKYHINYDSHDLDDFFLFSSMHFAIVSGL